MEKNDRGAGPRANVVVVYRGIERETYSCTPELRTAASRSATARPISTPRSARPAPATAWRKAPRGPLSQLLSKRPVDRCRLRRHG